MDLIILNVMLIRPGSFQHVTLLTKLNTYSEDILDDYKGELLSKFQNNEPCYRNRKFKCE